MVSLLNRSEGGFIMKKYILAISAILLFLSSISFAEEGTITLTLKEYQTLLQKKSYRLGLRAGVLLPVEATSFKDKTAIQGGLEFDAKLNENLDTGPRIAYCLANMSSLDLNASYAILQFGYGARLYLLSWGESGSSHGLINLYTTAEMQFMIANKTKDDMDTSMSSFGLITNPSSFAGIGLYGGAGIEIGFSQNTGAYLEVGYQTTRLKSSDDEVLPLQGMLVTSGLRLSFF